MIMTTMTMTRRQALHVGAASAAIAFVAPAAATEADPFATAVDEGLAYFRRRAEEQRGLARVLTEAVAARNLARARTAYVAARPPYEEIEVLAASFPERDADIDARPYAFEGGDTDPDFKGSHKVEGLIFRDEDLDAARPVAQELEGSLEELVRDLAARENFSAARENFSAKKTFEGLQALANEIGAKKISSEEETWSDRSLLIFRYNLVGIDSQFRPFAAALAGKNAVAADGVARAYRQAAAAVDAVYGDEPGGRPYSSVRVAERRAIVQGAYAYRDALAKAAETLGLD
jgi:iron uptake system component EfeO